MTTLSCIRFRQVRLLQNFCANWMSLQSSSTARREILWEQVELPKQLKPMRLDVFHATANRGLPYRRACKYVVTCHDIIDRLPEYCEGEHWRGRWRKKYADFVSRHSADKYITVSHFSKQDICRFYGLASDRVVVIHNAASPRFHEKVAERTDRAGPKQVWPARAILSVSWWIRKTEKRRYPGGSVRTTAR